MTAVGANKDYSCGERRAMELLSHTTWIESLIISSWCSGSYNLEVLSRKFLYSSAYIKDYCFNCIIIAIVCYGIFLDGLWISLQKDSLKYAAGVRAKNIIYSNIKLSCGKFHLWERKKTYSIKIMKTMLGGGCFLFFKIMKVSIKLT